MQYKNTENNTNTENNNCPLNLNKSKKIDQNDQTQLLNQTLTENLDELSKSEGILNMSKLIKSVIGILFF